MYEMPVRCTVPPVTVATPAAPVTSEFYSKRGFSERWLIKIRLKIRLNLGPTYTT